MLLRRFNLRKIAAATALRSALRPVSSVAPLSPIGQEDVAAVSSLHQHRKLVETLSHIPRKVAELEVKARENENEVGSYEQDAIMAASRSGLFYRQLKVEEEQMADAAHNYNETLKNIMELGRGTGLKHVQRIILRWYEPLNAAIEREKKLILNKVSGKDRRMYGPVMLLLPTEKLTVITLNTAVNSILRTGNIGISLAKIARSIGELVETEVNVTKLTLGNAKLPVWQQNIIKGAYDAGSKDRPNMFFKVRALLQDEPWSEKIKLKIGAALVKILIDSTKTEDGEDTFIHTTYFYQSLQKRLGAMRLDAAIFKAIAEKDMHHVLPRYLPMLVPPKSWNNKSRTSCYFRLRTSLMRTLSPSHLDALKRAEMRPVLEGLDYLGQIPWRINVPMLNLVRQSVALGIQVGEIPPNTNVPMPLETDCYRIPSKLTTPRVSNKAKASAARQSKKKAAKGAGAEVEAGTGNLEIDGVQVPEALVPDDLAASKVAEVDPEVANTPVFDAELYKEMCRRVKMKNAEYHSLRCDLQLKVWVAEKLEEDSFYFPYNLDFRGRAYPVPQNLSHLGSDLCRALLKFDEAKPLGDIGFDWLKVHLANLFGNNKQTLRDRVNWVESHMDDIIDSAKHPLDGRRWWASAEEPFQALATCMEIVNAVESGDPSSYRCSLPVHQDGSCNGLQHYAALGRDEAGGVAVNLMPSSEPQDVYSTVLDIVNSKIKVDAEISADEADPYLRERGKLARLVLPIVNRKVIKQTVMTSVYGVTKIGARAQIQARLEESLVTDASTVRTPDSDRDIFLASRFVLICTTHHSTTLSLISLTFFLSLSSSHFKICGQLDAELAAGDVRRRQGDHGLARHLRVPRVGAGPCRVLDHPVGTARYAALPQDRLAHCQDNDAGHDARDGGRGAARGRTEAAVGIPTQLCPQPRRHAHAHDGAQDEADGACLCLGARLVLDTRV